MTEISELSREYRSWTVSATAAGAPIDPTSDVVELAFAPPGTSPSAWVTADWVAATGQPPAARVLIGAGGDIDLAAGTYVVWLRITDNPERPVLAIDTLRVDAAGYTAPPVPATPAAPAPIATWVGDQSYLTTTPYLTPREYRSSPQALDPSDLVPGGSPAQIAAALATVIARASAEADRICRQVLGAHSLTEDAWLNVRRDGRAVFPTTAWPVLELSAASVGSSPSAVSAIGLGHGVRIGRTTIEIPVAGGAYVPGGPLMAFGPGGKVYVVATYVAGYPHGVLTANAAAGASTLAVSNPLGIYAGTRLVIYDDAATETVTAAAPPAGNVVTLAAPTAFAHTATDGVGVSALPPDAKDAIAHLVNARIVNALDGAGGESSEKIGNYSVVYADPGAAKLAATAVEMLAPYRRTGL